MQENKIEIAKSIPSFLIECLVWNTPNPNFNFLTYKQIIRETLAHLYNSTTSDDKCSNWGEVNEIKYLFRSSQPWTRDQVNNFILSAWQYIGYK